MRIFSEKIKYGLSAVFMLAKNYFNEHIQIKEIAHNENIPQHYLEKLLLDLKKAGIVESIRGIKGGYKLKKQLNQIQIIDVIEALEGPISVLNYASSSDVLKFYWKDVESKIKQIFTVTLEDLVNEEKKLEEKLFFQI